MNSILGALYRGQLNPDETIVPSDPEYRPLNRQIAAIRDQLKNRLSEQDFCKLEEMFCLRDKSDGLYMEAAFLHGFKLGAAMQIEVMIDREEFVRDAASGLSL
ncbi:hypothetical protein PAECIP111893_04276 [Paenibacillus plantiphilus]|uniref:Uncharacterized protein n=1 Tax=Paenibacillus plantiphilus TaxID=2905650 RepID=A0ABM9CKZ8_9BACL|nr:DUF6809 family protein [Paenibacillus plantiphilus]CAH1217425.1 hypothetical protein PAECIP111893_04276 [Paenibacillus plantiphilus]